MENEGSSKFAWINKHARWIVLLFIAVAPFIIYWQFESNQHMSELIILDKDTEAQEPTDYEPFLHIAYLHYLNTHAVTTIENFVYFMNFAYKPCHPRAFYTLIFNIDSEKENVTALLSRFLNDSLLKKIQECVINEKDVSNMTSPSRRNGFVRNTRIIPRLNKPGDDICAYVELMVSEYWRKIESWFRYFFFINSTVRGPFLPVYYRRPWWNVFTDMIEYSNDTVAAGPYMSCEFNPHLQSFFLAMNHRGLVIMKHVFRCPNNGEPEQNWIVDTEVKLGAAWIKLGYAFRSLLFAYNGAGSTKEIKQADCSPLNPFNHYPIRNEEKDLIYKDYPSLKNLPLSINIFEVTWVRYKSNSGHSHLDQYVPLFTEWMYKRLRSGIDQNNTATSLRYLKNKFKSKSE